MTWNRKETSDAFFAKCLGEVSAAFAGRGTDQLSNTILSHFTVLERNFVTIVEQSTVPEESLRRWNIV